MFNEKLENIPGFGCSDCKCDSHLFYGSSDEIHFIIKIIDLQKHGT